MYALEVTRFREGHSSTVTPGVHEKHVARLRHRFSGSDSPERIRRGSITTTRTRDYMEAPSTNRHGRNGPRRDHSRVYGGSAVRIGERQSDLVRRVRAEKQNASGEHVGTVVVDSHERQRRPPCCRPGDSKIDGSRRVVIRIANNGPLDADRRNRGVGSHRAGRRTGCLRRENCRTPSAA